MNDQFSVNPWRKLGWKNPFWELLRFYCSLRGQQQKEFLKELSAPKHSNDKWWSFLNLEGDVVKKLPAYCLQREKLLENALAALRTEEDAKKYCKSESIKWKFTQTKSKEHHQSSKTVIAAVEAIAAKVCTKFDESLVVNPSSRCVWFIDNHLHVTARNLDGAIPSLRDPYIVWEIKEYWGKTSGGSKMSDAVYECHLVGREIREFEERSEHKISHIVFLDGKNQWDSRKSDLARFIDLHNQGLIDHLFVGRSIETEWESILTNLVNARKRGENKS